MFLYLVLLSLCSRNLVDAEDVSVTKGDPVTLHSGLTEIRDNDEILWKFGHSTTLIAAINVRNSRLRVYEEAAEGRFRDRVRVDHQTGSLTISHTRSDHTGSYQLEFNGVRKQFYLTVYVEVSAMEGESVTLHSPLADLQENRILWSFREPRVTIDGINTAFCRVGELEKPADKILRMSMKLDPKTGSLIIPNATTEHSGPYMLLKNYVATFFSLTVHPFPVPVILLSSDSSRSCSSSVCELVCEVENVSHVTLSWYKGESLFSSISVSDLSRRVSLPVEIQSLNDSYTCVLNNSIRQQNTHLNVSLCRTVPDPRSVCFCGTTEAAVRLAFSALVGVVILVILAYDVQSSRSDQKRRLSQRPT